MDHSKKRVGLFKAVSLEDNKSPSGQETELEDPYCSALSNQGFSPVVIPTLQFRFTNLDRLSELLSDVGSYSALALTSPRAVEAVEKATPEEEKGKFGKVKVFAVGKKTSACAKRALNCQMEGEEEECGTSEAMAELVASRLGRDNSKKVLLPCGNLASPDAFGEKLKQFGGPKVESIVCYETGEHAKLRETLENEQNLDFAVFFSPSGLQYALPHLGEALQRGMKLCAIGPTTAAAVEEYGRECFAAAAKPNAQMLAEALREAAEKSKTKFMNAEALGV